MDDSPRTRPIVIRLRTSTLAQLAGVCGQVVEVVLDVSFVLVRCLNLLFRNFCLLLFLLLSFVFLLFPAFLSLLVLLLPPFGRGVAVTRWLEGSSFATWTSLVSTSPRELLANSSRPSRAHGGWSSMLNNNNFVIL